MSWRRPGVQFPSAPRGFLDVFTSATVLGGIGQEHDLARVVQTMPDGVRSS